MTQHLSRIVCAAVLFVWAGVSSLAQSPVVPVPPRKADSATKSAEPVAEGKKLPAPESSGLKLPSINYTRSRTYNLPVAMDMADRLLLNEIRLYVKTPGTEWTLLEKGDRDLKQFSCKVDADGEYWYTLALVDKQGKMTPADVNSEPPSQRVMVDTVPPVIDVTFWLAEGKVGIHCVVKDANPDLKTLKAVSRTEDGDVPLESSPKAPGVFTLKNSDMVKYPVFVSVKDLARNLGEREIDLPALMGAKKDAPKNAASVDGPSVPKNYLQKRKIVLPIVLSEEARPSVSEIQLFVKEGLRAEWKLHSKVGNSENNFIFEAPRDGEYHFAMVTVDKQGRSDPVDIKKEPGGLIVVVDTVPPVIKVEPWNHDGSLALRCIVEDANPDPATLKAVSRTDDGDVPLEKVSKEPGVFRVHKAEMLRFPVMVTAADLAGNESKTTVVLSELLNKVTTNAPPKPPLDPIPVPKSSPLDRSTDAKVGRIALKDAFLFLDTNDLEKAKIIALTVKAMAIAFGPDELTPEHLLREVQRRQDGTRKKVPETFVAPMPSGFGSNPSFSGPLGPLDKSPVSPPIRFTFKIDLKAPTSSLLPTPLKTPVKLPLWTNEDLAKVPELAFGEPISKKLSKEQAMKETAHAMAKINHLNAKKTDGFMLAMIEQRPDLRGLPFLMGDECRTREEQAEMFAIVANGLRSRQLKPDTKEFVVPAHRAAVAAMTQIFMPESAKLRIALANDLSTIPHIDATKALARLAIFSPEDEVRAAAIEGLKLRREKDYTDILMQGFRYPLPAVSKRAAEALVKLERKDLLVNLIEVLESPDPRLPARSASKDGFVVRELVKVNHHRNCLLCHAPGNTDNTPAGVLKVAVPLPGEPLPKPSEGGGYQSTPPPSPDIVVRLDMTYLRQDFSVMMPVSDAHPWPELQRFDFLVRTRELTAAEAKGYTEDKEPGRLSPYHRSALFALRELSGRDTEPTAAAWRKLLKL